MERLLIPIDFDRLLEGVEDDAAKWRLIQGMLCYCRGDDLPAFGAEKMVWGLVKKICDDWIAYCEKQRRNGKQPKTQAKPTKARRSQNKPDEAKSSQTEPTLHNITLHDITLHNTKEPPSALDVALDEFRQFRKEKHNPLTELAEKKLLKELDRLSGGNEETKIQILDQSIRNGWAGVFELRRERKASVGYEQHKVTDADLNHLLVNLDD